MSLAPLLRWCRSRLAPTRWRKGISDCPTQRRTGEIAERSLRSSTQELAAPGSDAVKLTFFLRRSVVRRAGPGRAEKQRLAVRQREVTAICPERSVLGLVPVDEDFHAGLQRLLGQA